MQPAYPTRSLVYEACVESLEDALAAERRGAHRIELCSALDQDGLTPSRALIVECKRQLSIPIMVMIRPRGGDFVHSDDEVARMADEIAFCKRSGVAGVVFGLLTPAGTIDGKNTERLVRAALPLDVTFHKAIDYSADVMASFECLNSIDGISRVLTSGGRTTAWEGRETLKAMHEMPGRRIELIAAGRLLPGNREQVADYTGIRELHGKRIV
ncbi:MAG: copper homeostasis protein CutC [Propionivibrio sp.]